MNDLPVVAVVPSAGCGRRLGLRQKKPFVPLGGKPLVAYTLGTLNSCDSIDAIVIACERSRVKAFASLVKRYGLHKVTDIVIGGSTRRASVKNCLARIGPSFGIVLIHDGARPLVDKRTISECIRAAEKFGASVVAVPESDTVKFTPDGKFLTRTLPRDRIFRAQTPQAFKTAVIRAAYALKGARPVTDDSALVERLGKRVRIVRGSSGNIKITTKEDLKAAEALLRHRSPQEMRMRVGIGYDIHRMVKGRRLVLGGVRIPYGKGPEAHSDGDVILHAVSDAILGALGAGDIGSHFPDTDPAYKGLDSMVILKKVFGVMRKAGYKANNVDTMVIAEAPRIGPFIERMRTGISGILGVDAGNISIKATTNEGVGAIGSGEAIAAYAIASLEERKR